MSLTIYANQMKTFRDLLVWQKAMLLVTDSYQSTNSFPKQEQFGLTSQLRRCAVSIPSNIAEGFGRGTNKDYHRIFKNIIRVIV
jgi:four helix bundle protein